MKILRLTNEAGEVMHASHGTLDAQVFLSVKLAEYGIRCELIDTTARQGLASSRRFPREQEDFPDRTPLGERLFGDITRLTAKGR